jgi:hypothetical protein
MTKKSDLITLDIDDSIIKAREQEIAAETDEQIIERLDQRFQILRDMTIAVKKGAMRGLIVAGPPGVGKSHGVEEILLRHDLFNRIADREPNYDVVKGTLSSVGLYAKLHDFKEAGDVVVFDDADNIFFDMLSLNLLKAALDTSKRRILSWNTDSRMLRGEGIPNQFEFKGSVIFITNIKFGHVRSKTLKEHLNALESRCHYIDLEMDTQREKMLRIKQIVGAGMLNDYHFADGVVDDILQFVEENKDRLRELSLRSVIKIADLYKSFPNDWKAMAATTCMRR